MTVPEAYEIDAFEVAHGFVITRFELLHNTGLEELLRNCATILADALTFLRIRILFHRLTLNGQSCLRLKSIYSPEAAGYFYRAVDCL